MKPMRLHDVAKARELASAELELQRSRFAQALPGSEAQRGSLGALLASAGALIRYGDVDPMARLGGVGTAAVESWLAVLDTQRIRQRWLRAVEEAVEAALGEDEERALWAEAAWEALATRDELANQLVALESWELLQPGRMDASARLSRMLHELDGDIRATVRAFTSVNDRRRALYEALQPAHRDGAWWFSERAACDGLIPRLAGGEDPEPKHRENCPDCRADLTKTREVERPPVRHLDAAILWALDLGTLSASDEHRWRAHARTCTDCALAISALSIDDDLEFVEEEFRAPLPHLRILPGGSGKKVLHEDDDVVISVTRTGDVLRLQVAPRRQGLRIAASLVLDGVSREPEREGTSFTLPRRGEGTLTIESHGASCRLPITIE